MSEQQNTSSIFSIPILKDFLIYAPLHNITALVNHSALRQLRDSLFFGETTRTEQLAQLVVSLKTQSITEPSPKQGELAPRFLGLLPTRGCNMACHYCDFRPSDETIKMPLDLARDATNWYMDYVGKNNLPHAEVHFFGGEPFCGSDVIDLAVSLAHYRASEIGCSIRFEVATNGTFSEDRCRWIADNINTVVLSFDGPEDIQDSHRPFNNGKSTYTTIANNARILSEGAAAFCIRACVTNETANRMTEIADWACREFRPDMLSFEPLQVTPSAKTKGMCEPDPWEFARNFIAASHILEEHGVEPVYATANIHSRQTSFCPVGNDVVIVSPDGRLDACYLLRHEWETKGMNLNLGYMDTQNGNAFQLNASRVEFVRQLNVNNKPLCATCFGKWHCAGGCHVNHQLGNSYDRLCIQNRIITLHNILKTLGMDDLAQQWLNDRDVLEKSVYQASDLLMDVEAAR